MKLRLSKGDIAFTLFVGLALTVLVFSLGLPSFGIGKQNQANPQSRITPSASMSPAASTNNVIKRENANIGTSSWQIPADKAAYLQIQAYANATSILPGQKMTFYVSTQIQNTSYAINIYRLGWYGGLGGRLMAKQENLAGRAQGYYNPTTHLLVGCSSCLVDVQTGLVEARWQPSYSLIIPSDWTTGVYLAKFVDANDMQTYVPFDILGNTHSTYVAVTSDTTYEAYNEWGGYSLYKSYNPIGIGSLGRGVKDSFNRPYLQGNGSGYVLVFEADAIHWLERQGYDLSYMSSVDLHKDSIQLLQHQAYLSLGHDEYWTKEMRDGVEYARDHGVGLAFLGANASYWQMRFEPASTGEADRTIVCYKVATADHDLMNDPLYGKDNTRVTSMWRDPIISRPENAMIGIMYSSYGEIFPWRVSPYSKFPILDEIGLQPGQKYGCNLVGNEWDRVFTNGATPAGLQVIGVSATVNHANQPDISNTTYYIAPSGAMVFATGSHYWAASLDSYRFAPDPSCSSQDSVVPGMQKLMAYFMVEIITLNHPSFEG